MKDTKILSISEGKRNRGGGGEQKREGQRAYMVSLKFCINSSTMKMFQGNFYQNVKQFDETMLGDP